MNDVTLPHSTLSRIGLAAIFLLLLSPVVAVGQTTYLSTPGGNCTSENSDGAFNWQDPDCWDQGSVPSSASDSVVIQSSDLVEIRGSSITIGALNVEDGGFNDTRLLFDDDATLTIDDGGAFGGSVTFGGSSTIVLLEEDTGFGEGYGGGTLIADGKVIDNDADLRTSTGGTDGVLRLTGSGQILDLQNTIERLETTAGASFNLDRDLTVTELVAGGDPTNSGLTVGDGPASGTEQLTVNGGGSSVSGDFTVGEGTSVTFNVNVSIPGNLTLNDSGNNGTGVTLSGVNQTVSGNLSINGGTYSVSDNTLTMNGFASIDGTLNVGSGTSGLFDANGAVVIETSGKLDLGEGELQIEEGLTNKNNFAAGGGALVTFDGPSDPDQTLSGTGLFNGSNSLQNVFVAEGSTVDPADSFADGDAVRVEGNLTIEDTGGNSDGAGQWGSGSTETADIIYAGKQFDVQDDNAGDRGQFFAARTEFNSNTTASDAVTANGAVFSVFELTSGYVKITRELEVNDKFRIGTGTVELVDTQDDTGRLIANDDFEVNDTYLPNGNKTTFSGRTAIGGGDSDPAKTSCTGVKTFDNDCEQDIFGSGDIDFGTVVIDSTDTRAKANLPEGAVADLDGGGLTIDASANDTNVQFILAGNSNLSVEGDVTNNGTFTPGNGIFTLDGSSLQDIETTSPLTFGVVRFDNSSDVELVNGADVTVSDSLSVTAGKVRIGTGDRFAVGGPARLASGNGNVSIAQSGDGKVVLLSDDGNGYEGYVQYVDASGDGTLDGTISGTLTHQREMTGGASWYYLSAPVGSTTDTFEGFLESGSGTDLVTKGVKGSDDETFEPTVRLYDETEPGPADADDAGWKGIDCSGYSGCVDGMSSTMGSGRGYAVYVFGTPTGASFPKFIDSQTADPRSSSSFTFSASDGDGTSNDSNVEGPGIDATPQDGSIDEKDGWNLLGNPYPSTIDFCSASGDGMTRESGLSPVVWVWDPQNAGDGTTTDGYATYNCDTDTGGGTNDDGGVTLKDGYIGPHQGFFVKANSTSNLKLSIDDITAAQPDTSGTFLKQNNEKPPAVQLQFELDGMRYSTSMGFVSGRKIGLDRSDGYYNGGPANKSGLSFHSVLGDGTLLTTSALPRDLSSETTIPVSIDGCNYGSELSGTATIAATMLRNLPDRWNVGLKDTRENTTIDLSKQPQYTFDYSGSCPSTKSRKRTGSKRLAPPTPEVVKHPVGPKSNGPDTRFQLLIKPDGGTLPVELTEFTGKTDQQAAVLNWTTASEQDNAGFYVQRQTADSTFSTLDGSFVEGAGTASSTTEYSYRVEDLDAGTHTFRLKQVDTDGSASFSDPVDVKVGLSTQYKLKTYPNPVRTQATVEFAVKEQADVTIALYNTLGQKVRMVYRGTPPAEETKRAQVDTQNLSSGVYFLRLEGEGVTGTQRMTVVK